MRGCGAIIAITSTAETCATSSLLLLHQMACATTSRVRPLSPCRLCSLFCEELGFAPHPGKVCADLFLLGGQVGQESAIAIYEVIENLCWAGGRNSDGVGSFCCWPSEMFYNLTVALQFGSARRWV